MKSYIIKNVKKKSKQYACHSGGWGKLSEAMLWSSKKEAKQCIWGSDEIVLGVEIHEKFDC